MEKDILVLTATLGMRKSLWRTIDSVRRVGGERVRHVVIAPLSLICDLREQYPDTEFVEEPEDSKGIYAALNFGFQKYGNEYRYITYLNDDDFWLDDFKEIIDETTDGSRDIIYGKTRFVNRYGVKIDSQTCSGRFEDFTKLLQCGIILMTQQAAILRTKTFFDNGGFDESYKLCADTKLWALLSRKNVKHKYIGKEVAAYTIDKGNQLSSDHKLQEDEHRRILGELALGKRRVSLASLRFRLSNITTYAKRMLGLKGYRHKPVTNRAAQAMIVLLPWRMRRYVLNKYLLYDLSPTSHIGLSFFYPKFLKMDDGARIGHLNVAINLDTVIMGKNCIISRSNWITGFPTGTDSPHFAHDKHRRSELIMGDESSITKNHHIDCTNTVEMGEFAAIGGYNSQILTHSVDMYECRQDSKPITIGKYSLVATRSIITGGAQLPAYSVLCAGAYLGKKLEQEWMMYGGVPAKPIKEIPKSAKRFSRKQGYIY